MGGHRGRRAERLVLTIALPAGVGPTAGEALALGLGWMIVKSALQPKPFCGSVTANKQFQ